MTELVSVTCAKDGTVHTLELSAAGLRPVSVTEVGSGVTAMALLSPTRAFVAVKDGPAVVTLDLVDERWVEVARTSVPAHQTAMAISADGRFLLGAAYDQGTGRVWPIDDAGRLGESTAEIAYRNLHCVIAVGEHVYFTSLGDDLLACYRLTSSGALEPLAVPTVAAPKGSGPRHVVSSDDGRNLYVVTEFGGEVVRYERDLKTGVLAQRQAVAAHDTGAGLTHSRFGADPMAEHLIWGADLHLLTSDSGDRWIIASERTESTLSVLPVATDGSLGEQVSITHTELQPRGFVVRDDLVVCAGERSDQVSLFRLEGDGRLTLVDRAPVGKGGNWVRAVS